MRLLVTGSRGQLGLALQAVAPRRGHELVGYDLPELDVTESVAVAQVVDAVRPDAVVNCAAFTAVDAAEAEESRATAVNGHAVAGLAAASARAGAVLVQISTDYVFDGSGERPWREEDPPRPLSAYGRSKLAGEVAAARAREHLIVRTAWLFGEGANFVGAIRKQVEAGKRELNVVADQQGSPTYAVDLAEAIVELLEVRARGVVHAVNEGVTTWHGFASEIVRQLGAGVVIHPIGTRELGRAAPRPANSRLNTARLQTLLGRSFPPWQDALARYLTAGVR